MVLSPFEFTLVVLAAARATRLVTADTIFDAWRDRVTRSRRAKLGELVACPFCAGWWLSVVTYVVAVVALGRVHEAPWLAHGIECWAVMGAQMVVNAGTEALANT